jgi:hypothetical protein
VTSVALRFTPPPSRHCISTTPRILNVAPAGAGAKVWFQPVSDETHGPSPASSHPDPAPGIDSHAFFWALNHW